MPTPLVGLYAMTGAPATMRFVWSGGGASGLWRHPRMTSIRSLVVSASPGAGVGAGFDGEGIGVGCGNAGIDSCAPSGFTTPSTISASHAARITFEILELVNSHLDSHGHRERH